MKSALRPAAVADSNALRALSTQLGYAEVKADIFSARLEHILLHTCGAVFVIETDVAIVGYVHVYAAPLLSTPSDHPLGGYCEIGSLVVDRDHRRAGMAAHSSKPRKLGQARKVMPDCGSTLECSAPMKPIIFIARRGLWGRLE